MSRKNIRKRKPRRRIRWGVILIPVLVTAAIAALFIVPRFQEEKALKGLGYGSEEITAIREYGLSDQIRKNSWHSGALAKSLKNHTLNTDYISLYAALDEDRELTETDFLLYSRLADAGYEEDQLQNLFQNLRFWEMTPLLLFDYQWDETKYIDDCLKNRAENSVDAFRLSGSYRRNYRHTYETDISDPVTILVNRSWYLPEGYEPPELTKISSRYAVPGQSLAKTAADSFIEMCEAGIANGTSFFLAGSYTSYESQKSQYDKQVSLSGQEKADALVLRPGFNEHQTGMCVNVSSTYETKVKFAESNTRAWLRGACAGYGWIERYPAEKSIITGVKDEPDHFRYLGRDLAILVAESKLTYDEYYCLYLKGWHDETLIPKDEVLKATNYGKKQTDEELTPEESPAPQETPEASPESTEETPAETADPQG